MNLSAEEEARYSRHINLSEIGIAGQAKLKESKVIVIGAGGLGCPALQYLAAAGVGTIGLIDFDWVDFSNLQRQILFNHNMVGKSKVEMASKVLTDINPYINIEPYNTKLTSDNAFDILAKYDVIIDGSDNFATRYLVNDVCFVLKKPLCFGSMFKFEGQVSVFNLNDSSPTYRCLFPEPPDDTNSLNCSEAGVIGVLPGIIGSMQALEAIKIITGVGETLSGKLMCYNGLTQDWVKLGVNRNQSALEKLNLSKEKIISTDYDSFNSTCSVDTIPEITSEELLSDINEYTVIDIREIEELPKISLPNLKYIPLSTLNSDSYQQFNSKIVFICQSGRRSYNFINAQLKANNTKKELYNLKGGVQELIRYIPLKNRS